MCFGDQPATVVSRTGTTSLVVTVPAAQQAGQVDVVVSTGFGTSAPRAYTYS